MNEMKTYEWPRGWGGLEDGQSAAFTEQLLIELGPDDPLYPWFEHGAIRAIGGSVSSDDVVYEIDDWETPFFVSHLTWTAADTRPLWLQRLRPRARPDPGVVAISSLSELDGWCD